MAKYEYYENKKREQFLDRLANIFQTKRRLVEQFVSLEQKQSLRVNTLKVEEPGKLSQEFERRGWEAEAIPWCRYAYFLHSDKEEVSRSDLFNNGKVFIQNASSLIPPLTLDPQPGEYILDMNAAPGGKAAHIAALSNNQASLWVDDIDIRRVRTMKEIFEIYAVEPEMILNQPAQHLDETLTQKFDKILLDAQCSGEGLVDLNHPRAMRYWSLSRIKKSQKMQKSMITAGYNLLKPGGILVYSTCTFAPEENEVVINHLLNKTEDLTVVPIKLEIVNRMPGLTEWRGKKLSPSLSECLRIIPTPHMEGFFVCKLRKDKR